MKKTVDLEKLEKLHSDLCKRADYYNQKSDKHKDNELATVYKNREYGITEAAKWLGNLIGGYKDNKRICHICGCEGEHTPDCGATIFVNLTADDNDILHGEEDEDYFDDEEERFEEECEYASSCTCGGWQFNKNNEPIHIADCVCGNGL